LLPGASADNAPEERNVFGINLNVGRLVQLKDSANLGRQDKERNNAKKDPPPVAGGLDSIG